MRKYRLVAKKGEGTFSEVLKAQNVKDGKYHAIKCMKNRFESIDQVNNLREIQALRRLSPHDHIISLEEVLYDQPTGRLALVFELMDANLYELIKGRRHYLNPQLIKGYMWQLMKSLDHMHRKGIFHRDIKPENILIENCSDVSKGLKLADLGSCRGIYSKQPYTEYISTRWYRAPECLLTDGYYGPEMDLWGAGCVFFEITSLYPLFPGSNEVDQINRIHKVLGTPSDDVLNKFRSKGNSHISLDFPESKGMGIPQLIPHASADCVDLIVKLLKYDASERISARETMRHPYFKECREAEARRSQHAAAVNHTNNSQTETSRSAQPVRSGANDSSKISAKGGDSHGHHHANTGKALPSLSGSNYDSRSDSHKNAQATSSDNSYTNYTKNNTQKINASYQNHHGGGHGHGHGVHPSTLPPIQQGHQHSQNNNKSGKYFYTDGNRNGGNAVVAQPKKKKKDSARLRRNNGQNAEQVMRTYGVPQGGNAGDHDLGITSGNSISYGMSKMNKR